MQVNQLKNFINENLDFLNSIETEFKDYNFHQKLESILQFDKLYYIDGQPKIEDNVYDQIVKDYKDNYNKIKLKLKELKEKVRIFEKENNISNLSSISIPIKKFEDVFNKYELKVGSSLDKTVVYQKKEHFKPMLSLDNTYNIQELCDFIESVLHDIGTSNIYDKSDDKDMMFIIEEKIDGLSCDLYYKNGKLDTALTRGDGSVGEVITHKVKNMSNIPEEIDYKDDIHIRGEILLKYQDWDKLKTLDLGYKNPRNAAAGIIRSKNDDLDGYLSFIAYEVLPELESDNKKTQLENLNMLTYLGLTQGFEIPKFNSIDVSNSLFTPLDEKIKKTIEEIIELNFKEVNENLKDYPTDGLVFKLNPIKYQKVLGKTAKFPRYNIAYKFRDLEYTTRVKDIVWQVGRTGKLTPVVEVEPVDIDGSTISRVTAHNLEQMVRLGNIAIGKDIVIVKSAMVIPKIIRVKDYPIDSIICDKIDLSKIEYPKKCPSCGSTLVIEGPDLICNNINCRDRNLQAISFFCERNYMNIEGLSIGIITTLYDKGYLRKIEDIYKLYMFKHELETLPGFGVKSIKKLLESIEISKNNEPYRLIAALGYPNIGLVLSKDLVRKFGNNLNNLIGKTESDIKISGVSNVGEVVMGSLMKLINDIPKIIEFCNKYNIRTKSETSNMVVDSKFKDKIFVITGKMNNHSRKYYEDLIRAKGGIVTSTVNKKTTYLVQGENATERKVTLANVMDKPIITENMLIDMLELKN